jgi:DNA-binding transcriptional ArsR family regulator
MVASLDMVFSALADPTRRAMLARLTSGEATVTELAAPFNISMPAISKHLKVLERAGLVSRGRSAQWLRTIAAFGARASIGSMNTCCVEARSETHDR